MSLGNKYNLNKLLRVFKPFIITLVIITIFILFLKGISKYAINWNNYEEWVVSQLEESLGEGSVSISHLDGSLFMPKINIHNVYINMDNDDTVNDTVIIPKMEIKLSVLSMLFLTPKITSLSINSADFQLSHINNLSSLNTKQKVFNININDSNLRLNSNLFHDIKLEKLNIEFGNTLGVNGSIGIGKYTHEVAINIDDKEQSISINSELFTAKLQGKQSQGKLEVKGQNLSNNIGNLIKPIAFNTSLWEEFTITADISWSDESFKIENFKLLDNNISIDFGLERLYSSNYTNLKMSINKINLDALLDSQNQTNFSLLTLTEYLEGNKGDNSLGKISIEGKEITYNNKVIENVIFDSTINGKTLEINKFTSYMPGETRLDIKGNVLNNNIISAFTGDASLFSKDAKIFLEWLLPLQKRTEKGVLNVDSELSVTPNSFSLNNTQLTIDDVSAEFDLFIKNGLKGKQVKSKLKVTNLDLDDYDFSTLTQNKLLHSINYELDFDLSAYNSHYSHNIIYGFSLKLLSDTGKILLKDIRCDSKNLQGTGNITLINQGIESSIDADLSADYVNTTIFKINSILDIDYDPDHPKVEWSSKPLSTFGLDTLNGKIVAKIANLDTEKFSLKNLGINFSLGNKVLSIQKIEAEIDEDGKIDLTGNIGMDSELSVLLSFALNNIGLSKIINNIFDIDAIDGGKISCVGSMKSKGNNLNELVEGLSGKMEVASRNIQVKGFDIDKLLSKLPSVSSNSELATLTKVLIYSDDTAIEYFDGLVNIKNGIMASTLKFKTDLSTGVLSSHLSLKNFETNSNMRFFFIDEDKPYKILSIDMAISGPIWLPKISFDNNKMYNMIVEHKEES